MRSRCNCVCARAPCHGTQYFSFQFWFDIEQDSTPLSASQQRNIFRLGSSSGQFDKPASTQTRIYSSVEKQGVFFGVIQSIVFCFLSTVIWFLILYRTERKVERKSTKERSKRKEIEKLTSHSWISEIYWKHKARIEKKARKRKQLEFLSSFYLFVCCLCKLEIFYFCAARVNVFGNIIICICWKKEAVISRKSSRKQSKCARTHRAKFSKSTGPAIQRSNVQS